MNSKILFAVTILTIFCSPSLTQVGTKQKRPLPYDYGRVVIDNHATKSELAPVVFEHWIHRSRFTCRVCHVDVGFAMKAGATGITAADNGRGYYCGACHNGKPAVDGKAVFQACSKLWTDEDAKRCQRCHSYGLKVASDFDFFKFNEPLPKERFGNGVDWERAEQLGLIKPADSLAGFSTSKNSMAVEKDFALGATVQGMPDIIFSHKK